MKRLQKWQSLSICLAVEVIIFVLGMEFFNPFPIHEIRESHSMVLVTIFLYAASCACGITAARKYGILEDTHMVEIVFLCLLLSFMARMWPIILGYILLFTLVLLISTKLKSPES